MFLAILSEIINFIERISKFIDLNGQTVLNIFILLILALLIFIVTKKNKTKEEEAIEHLKGEWEYKLTFNLPENNKYLISIIHMKFNVHIEQNMHILVFILHCNTLLVIPS